MKKLSVTGWFKATLWHLRLPAANQAPARLEAPTDAHQTTADPMSSSNHQLASTHVPFTKYMQPCSLHILQMRFTVASPVTSPWLPESLSQRPSSLFWPSGAQLEHTNQPQYRQWCLRRRVPNLRLQIIQEFVAGKSNTRTEVVSKMFFWRSAVPWRSTYREDQHHQSIQDASAQPTHASPLLPVPHRT